MPIPNLIFESTIANKRLISPSPFLGMTCVAQSDLGTTNVPIELSDQERVDTLVKYVRKQFYSNNFAQTITVGQETLELAKNLDDRNAIFRVSSLMGNAFLQTNDTIEAKRIFFKTIQEAEKNNDTTRSLTTARIDLGNMYALQGKKELAILKYKEALPLAERLNDTTHLFILNYNISEQSLDLEKIKEGEKYVAQTQIYATKVKAEAYQAVAKLISGRLYYLKDQPKMALPFLEESIRLAESSGYTEALIDAHEVASKVQIELGNFEVAIDHLLIADDHKSEKYKADKIQALETVTGKFKLDQYQQELRAKTLQNEIDRQTTKRETTIFWVKIASGILFLFSIFLLVSFIKRKRLLKNLIEKNKQYLEAKEEIESQAKAKSKLFANITHELRTPLYGIIGISSHLLDDKKLHHQSDNLNSLKFSADYLLSLINNVLQLTANQKGKEKLKHSVFNLRDLIINVIKSSRFINTTHPNKYTLHIDSTIPHLLLGDDIKLSQVLMNLVSNASKFTHDGQIGIEVSCIEKKEKLITLQFKVSDNGIGIPEEKLGSIFSEFSRTSSNYEHQGSGLGLPIVKKLLALMNSDIELSSKVNEGTSATFQLDFETLTEKDQVIEAKPEHPSDTLKGNKILIVDDNKINLLVTQRTLEKFGAEVKVAHDGVSGIKIADSKDIDLILMDINMPKMNGIETSKIIKSSNKGIPIIALTAVEEEKIIIDDTDNLFDYFIIKPYNQYDFIEIIAQHVKVKA